ncbi:unnamed protein product [Pieris macdunnoughi]|uniref:DDE Tnp4 domain-containing protein n=1 Tax=Pieris macdunnoughi TaxID=345717 RepID=A0A821UK57_9NEOP|nr:unnamed protein product [Pieris macdunnoughi]
MAMALLFSDSDDSDLLFLSDTDSESEEERSASSRRLKRVNYMQSLDDAEFTFRFRLSKPAVETLLTRLMPFVRVTSTRNHGVSPLHQMLLTLRFYALGTMLISVADFVGVSKSTAGRIVRDISSAIAHLYDEYIFVHQQSVEKFYQIARFPCVFAAVDCTHIRIQSPSVIIGEEFRNRKGYFSFNVQAICDADLRFMNVVARWPGSTHDATIFNNSVLRAQCDAGMFGSRWMLGDSAYPNRSYLLTPLLNPFTEAEQRYNEAHIKTRNTIERTFGIWKRRFPIVALTMRLSLPNAQAVIIATSVLHNICRNYSLEELPAEVDLLLEDSETHEHSYTEVQDVQERAVLIRNYFQ